METKVTTFQSPMPIGRNLALLGALGVGVAAFLPWGKVADFSVSGIEGDGIITLIIAVLALVFLFIKKIPLWIVAILGIIVEVVGIIDIVEMSQVSDSINGTLNSIGSEDTLIFANTVGMGLYITVVGAGLVIIGSLIQFFQNRK